MNQSSSAVLAPAQHVFLLVWSAPAPMGTILGVPTHTIPGVRVIRSTLTPGIASACVGAPQSVNHKTKHKSYHRFQPNGEQ